jgi:pimeloyl-ACP methyl ester carboxylesterase
VFIPGYVTHLELQWKMPSFAPFLEELASFSRLIRFDKRGTGMSDAVSGAPTLERRMDDVRAVMDAVGSRRAAFYGLSEGAAMSILFAATYPERTAALVVRSAFPRTMWAPDYPWGRSEDEYEREVNRALQAFGPREQARESVRALGEFTDEETDMFLEMIRFGESGRSGGAPAYEQGDRRSTRPACRAGADADPARFRGQARPGRGRALHGVAHSVGTSRRDLRRRAHRVWELRGDRLGDKELPDGHLGVGRLAGAGARPRARDRPLHRHRPLVGEGERARRPRLARAARTAPRPRPPRAGAFRGRELDTAGDGFFASFDGPARAIRCACAIVDGMLDLEIRAGLHTGECELVDGKVAGIAVHTGARVAAQAQPRKVLVSSTVKDLVAGSGIRFADRGVRELAGVLGEWHLFAVEGD